MRVLQQFSNPIYSGAITSMCLDRARTWIVTGSLTGTLTLWDIRFGLSLKTWRVGSAAHSGLNARVHQCAAHPVNKQWIIAASETRSNTQYDGGSVLVEIWDLEKTEVVETLVSRDVSVPTHGQAATLITSVPPQKCSPVAQTPAEAIAMLLQSRSGQNGTKGGSAELEEESSPGDIRALAVGLDFGGQGTVSVMKDGFVLTGGLVNTEKRQKDMGYILMGSEDHKLRLWYLGQGQIERSMIISGMDADRQPPSFRSVICTEKVWC